MIDLPLVALTRAWVTTTIASNLLLLALAAAQLCSDQVYLQNLRQAVQLTAKQPPPDFGRGNVEDVANPYAARSGHTGS